MDTEVKRIVAALREQDGCDMRKNCDGCVCEKYCYAENGENLQDDAADLIEKQSAEIEELKNRIADAMCAAIYNGHEAVGRVEKLRNENEELRNRVYNLTLYLHEVRNAYVMQDRTDDVYRVWEYLNKQHPEIPSYNPAILEEAAEP